MSEDNEVVSLAFQGNWKALLPILKEQPNLVNQASGSKGYTPLHQTAWHGAPLSVIGMLLRLGADRRIRTINKHQTALEIAIEKHRIRADLAYILSQQRLTIAQLMRKIVCSEQNIFTHYDGNQALVDKMITYFGVEPCPESFDELTRRIENAFIALTGVDWLSSSNPRVVSIEYFNMNADTEFWNSRFLHTLREYYPNIHAPLEKEWAVVSDLFDPAPEQWGYRGDLFLWLEMRQILTHVQIPDDRVDLAEIIKSAFHALTGKPLRKGGEFFVNRFSRGGMSSGMIYADFWAEHIIPQLEKRCDWLRESWVTLI